MSDLLIIRILRKILRGEIGLECFVFCDAIGPGILVDDKIV